MQFKECYVSKEGISCITNINTLHNIKEITINKFDIKSHFIFYTSLRIIEFFIKDVLSNKNIFTNINNDEFLLTSIIFN
jgi:hypothetical protein